MSGDHSDKGHGFIHLKCVGGDANEAARQCRANADANKLPPGVVLESASAMEIPEGPPINAQVPPPPGKNRKKGSVVIVHVHTSDGAVSEAAHLNVMATADRLAQLSSGSGAFNRAHEHWCCWSDH